MLGAGFRSPALPALPPAGSVVSVIGNPLAARLQDVRRWLASAGKQTVAPAGELAVEIFEKASGKSAKSPFSSSTIPCISLSFGIKRQKPDRVFRPIPAPHGKRESSTCTVGEYYLKERIPDRITFDMG